MPSDGHGKSRSLRFSVSSYAQSRLRKLCSRESKMSPESESWWKMRPVRLRRDAIEWRYSHPSVVIASIRIASPLCLFASRGQSGRLLRQIAPPGRILLLNALPSPEFRFWVFMFAGRPPEHTFSKEAYSQKTARVKESDEFSIFCLLQPWRTPESRVLT